MPHRPGHPARGGPTIDGKQATDAAPPRPPARGGPTIDGRLGPPGESSSRDPPRPPARGGPTIDGRLGPPGKESSSRDPPRPPARGGPTIDGKQATDAAPPRPPARGGPTLDGRLGPPGKESYIVGPPLAGGLPGLRTGFRERLWGHPLRLACFALARASVIASGDGPPLDIRSTGGPTASSIVGPPLAGGLLPV